MANFDTLNILFRYIVSYLLDNEFNFGKTKFVKLLYLIDVESYVSFATKLTGLEWIFYHYGPYSLEIDEVLRKSDLDILQEEVITKSKRKAIILRTNQYVDLEKEEQHLPFNKYIVDKVLDKWASEELNPLLSYVYFHTEPMQNAKRGEVLDFSRIPLRTAPRNELGKMAAIESNEQRARFQKAKVNYFSTAYSALDPKPRFDSIFLEGLDSINADEFYTLPKGHVIIDDDSKRRIKEQMGFD